MSYTVLARRYRSRDFDEIVGQEPIARTLRNAIDSDRIAHAYLFCGTRGVGKTSMARIFAKAINATDELEQRDAIADAILRGDDLDVVEIDGASNRGVNEARELIAGAGLSPARCRYKVYIIDEVHMLTREAFNTLLKTMEEPPSHVKFILCTTEPHKVPATIQSRCQRFDFRPLPTTQIAQQLRHVLTSESIDAADDVITQLARLGNGSMRDALSIMDRLLATGENPLTMQTLQDTLGLPDRTRVMQLVDAIVAGDAGAALESGASLLETGATVEQVMQMLAEHFRDLMIALACSAESELLEHPADVRAQLAQQAASFDGPALVQMVVMCDHVARISRDSITARAMLDALLVRLAMSEHMVDAAALLDRTAGSGAPADAKKKVREQPAEPAGTRTRLTDPLTASPPADHQRTAALRESAPEAAPAVLQKPQQRQAAPRSVESEPKPIAAPDGAELWRRVISAELDRGARRRVELYEFASGDAECLHLRLSSRGEQSPTLCQSPQYVEGLVREVERIAGRRVRVVIDPPAARADDEQTSVRSASEQELAAVREDPNVQRAVELFDGIIAAVTPREVAARREDV